MISLPAHLDLHHSRIYKVFVVIGDSLATSVRVSAEIKMTSRPARHHKNACCRQIDDVGVANISLATIRSSNAFVPRLFSSFEYCELRATFFVEC
jgi:hypothetical protein